MILGKESIFFPVKPFFFASIYMIINFGCMGKLKLVNNNDDHDEIRFLFIANKFSLAFSSHAFIRLIDREFFFLKNNGSMWP